MDDIPDCGWIIGLPEGWVCAHTAVVRYCDILVNRTAGEDLAPWLPMQGAGISDKVRRDARICAAFQSALLNGRLSGSIFDGTTLRSLPKAAFIYPRVMDTGLRNGSIELDPLWPDDWRAWNGRGWAFPKDQFNAWLSSDEAYRVKGLPPDTALSQEDMLPHLSIREPSQRKRVALSEAISWIAFGMALDADRLRDAIRWDRLANGDLQEAQRKVAQAVETLLNAGADEKIDFYGRYENGRDNEDATTKKIEPHYLASLIRDGAHFGSRRFSARASG